MATVNVINSRKHQFTEVAPFGNLSSIKFKLELKDGVVVGGDSTDALGVGDKVLLGVLPEGLCLEVAKVIISTAGTTDSTMSLGFEYVDTALSADNDAEYFLPPLEADAVAAGYSDHGKALVTLKAPAYLVATNSGAVQDGDLVAEVIIIGEYVGAK